MGSGCCKNVRVTTIPQEKPVNINNSEDYPKRSFNTFPLTQQIDVDIDKINHQTIETDLPQEPNLNENEKISTQLCLPELNLTNENKQINDSKRISSFQLPPLIQNEKHHIKRRTSRKIDRKMPTFIPHLPSIPKSLCIENDDNLVESISDENHSDNNVKLPDDWHLLTIPDGSHFSEDDRFFTSTPIPPSPEQSDSDEEHAETLKYLLRPLSNHMGSDEEYLSNQEQFSSNQQFNPIPIPNLQLSPQFLYSLPDKIQLPMLKIFNANENNDDDDDDFVDDSLENSTIYLSNRPTIVHRKINPVNTFEILYPESFNERFLLMRQHVIDNNSYRLIIEAWRPHSIQQLVEHIKNFAMNKSILDRLWIIFYWITRNIEYDTVPYIGKKHVDKSPDIVFRTRKAISEGYANFFLRLCEDLDIICEKIHGYCKTYIFDPSTKTNVPMDHNWNAVQINQCWYLIDVTWSAGHLDDKRIFQRQLNSYYFLPRPDEMIYHHFPAIERWQLLKQSVQMSQYMQMPRLWPRFFQSNLQLLDPHDTIHVDYDPRQSYATVFIKCLYHLNLIATLTLDEKEIDGGHQIRFDSIQRMFHCYFAPISLGLHLIRFFTKIDQKNNGLYHILAELELDVRQIPLKPISFPKTWKCFFDFNLEILWPRDTHLIKMDHGDTHTEILLYAPSDIEVIGRLTIDSTTKIPGGHCTYLDRRKNVWRCLFAPPHDGLFEGFILAKRRLDPGSFNVAVRFKIKAKRIPNPPVSYPKTWQLFHDLDLQVEMPRDSAIVVWQEYNSYVQVCIRTPDDVQLMSCIERSGFRIENGSLTQFNSEKQYWQIFFAPERTGDHKLLIFAHCSTPHGVISGIALEFLLKVTQIRHSIKFPIIYTTFLTKRCRIYEPINGVLKRNTTVTVHCEIPNAKQVDLTIDSKWIKSEGYQNSILKREITVGTKEVIIYAKYEENTVYSELIKYIVQ